jgi:Cytochrome c
MNATTAPPSETPVEAERRVRRRRMWLALLLGVFLVGTYLFWRIVSEPAEQHAGIEEHFKYGSIGADNTARGIPIRLWRVLPEMFPEHLPGGGNAGTGYDAFGMVVEPGRDCPIGFSKRRVLGLELVGMNCAVCHTGTVRATPESQRQVVLGMPSNTVDLQAYFQFLFRCAGDSRFTVDAVMDRIRAQGDLDWYERMAYPRAVRQFREQVLAQQAKVDYWGRFPQFGPGRVDTFNPYKRLFFNMDVGQWVGTADFPSLWNQRPREGMNLHWDGNNSSVRERNISAAIGAGVIAPHSRRAAHPSLDEPSMNRIAEWILDLPSPKFPKSKIDNSKLARGKQVFDAHCASCHAMDGSQVGQVVPITSPKLGTDPHRLNSFAPEMVDRMNTWGTGYSWRFTHFSKTNGYSNSPLDGIWLRGPYLHNGSVPTLNDLLKLPAERPVVFRRGNDVYDWENVGFDSKTVSEGPRVYFEFDTRLPGNGNGGHTYGTELPPADKVALIEYLKTF